MEGEWGEDKKKANRVNIYAQCEGRRKAVL